jgi:eukaryotic-like serine/threonine-protein kinase
MMLQGQPQPLDETPKDRLHIGYQIQNPYKEQPMPKVGDKIGPNRVEVLVGEGGMANVYKVWHEGLEVVRAVKVLKKAFHQESKERFLTEAKILADISHPNIVEIHSIGYIDRQIPFIEMEFVEGTSIKKLIMEHQRVPITAALSIAYFVSQALKYAHVKDYTLYGKVYHGLIHRDIKPDNIVVGKNGIVKLMDFGVARPSEVSLHTVGAKIVGTLIYLSPEQLNGTTLDHRSDLFSLGTVLYEMITGNRAFPHKSLQDLVEKKMKGEYAPLASHTVAVTPSINTLVDRCLALDPNDRYPSAADLGEAIFSALHEITDRAPADIIARFMANPASLTMVNLKKSKTLPKMPAQEKPKRSFPWVWIALCLAGAIGAGILLAIFQR